MGVCVSQPERVVNIVHFNDVYNIKAAYTEEPIGGTVLQAVYKSYTIYVYTIEQSEHYVAYLLTIGAARFIIKLDEIKEKLRKEKKCPPLIIFSGDFVGPSLMSSVTHGAHMIELFNSMGVHYGTFGNHEVDFGYQDLKNRLTGVDDDVADDDFDGGKYDYPASKTKVMLDYTLYHAIY
jgi:2',3'-cyclic-nucleotide 2'-phosphodiesterase (5'-nucleotidase family)